MFAKVMFKRLKDFRDKHSTQHVILDILNTYRTKQHGQVTIYLWNSYGSKKSFWYSRPLSFIK